MERPGGPAETASGRLHALAGARRLRAGMHPGCAAREDGAAAGRRSLAYAAGGSSPGAGGERRRVGAGHGVALAVCVPAPVDEGVGSERAADARAGADVDAAPADHWRVPALCLWSGEPAALAGKPHRRARHRTLFCALAGDWRSADGCDLVARRSTVALD